MSIEAIHAAGRLAECQQAARSLYGDQYDEKLEPYRKIIRDIQRAGEEDSSSPLAVAAKLVQMPGVAPASLLIWAAAADLSLGALSFEEI